MRPKYTSGTSKDWEDRHDDKDFVNRNFYLSCEHPCLMTPKVKLQNKRATEKTSPSESSYINYWKEKLGISKSSFLSLCLIYFCILPNYAVRQYIFPYYKYFDKERFSSFPLGNGIKYPEYKSEEDSVPVEGSENDFRSVTNKIHMLTVTINWSLYKRFIHKCSSLLPPKTKTVDMNKNSAIPFWSIEDSTLNENKTNQMINAILTFMSEFKLIQPRKPIVEFGEENFSYFKNHEEAVMNRNFNPFYSLKFYKGIPQKSLLSDSILKGTVYWKLLTTQCELPESESNERNNDLKKNAK